MSTGLQVAISAIIVIFCSALVYWGNAYGSNARKIAEIKLELIQKNAEIKAYTLRDDQAAIDADLMRNEGYQKALSELGTVDRCIVTPAMVKAFERIVQ